MNTITVGLVDRHPVMADAISAMLSTCEGLQVVKVGHSVDDVVEIAGRIKPDVLIWELFPENAGLKCILDAQAASPDTRFVIYTGSTRVDDAVMALSSGAAGYVLKTSPRDELPAAVRAAAAGEKYISASFAARVITALQSKQSAKSTSKPAKLSAREEQIVRLLLHGQQNREIAESLILSEKTVKSYMTTLMQKLNARNRLEVVFAAQKVLFQSQNDRRAGKGLRH